MPGFDEEEQVRALIFQNLVEAIIILHRVERPDVGPITEKLALPRLSCGLRIRPRNRHNLRTPDSQGHMLAICDVRQMMSIQG